MENQEFRDTAFVPNDEIYNKPIRAVPTPQEEIGMDLEHTVLRNITDAIETSRFDSTALNSFTQVSRTRNELYNTLDYMAEDTTLSAVLETYCEDATETNDQGRIVWAESDDANAAKFVEYLLNALSVDKNIYSWTHCLVHYGDVYLRLYRESEYDNLLFTKPDEETKPRKALNEDVQINAYSKNDNYVHYVEMERNPAQLFELTRFGKTAAYVKTDVIPTSSRIDTLGISNTFLNKYSFNKNDVNLFEPTEFVHGSLDVGTDRYVEEVQLFLDDNNSQSYTYQVKTGQSLLLDSYKTWRQLMLLENSVLLNRVTQSSIVRVIGVEVGDMPKEAVQPHLMNIKQLIEQKAALDVGNAMSEYSTPGPIVNNIYIPTRNGQGVITTQQIGGDVNVGELVDLDYYNDKLFGGLRVPKQYFGKTDDAAGFSGGQSLSIISSRYAKMIKRIQNVMCQVITDMINLILIDTNNEAYINKFRIRMLAPTTQEEVDRRDNLSNRVGLVNDIMTSLSDIESVPTKLKILKSLLANTITDSEVIDLLQEEIDRMETELQDQSLTDDSSDELFGSEENFPGDETLDFGTGETSSMDFGSDLDFGSTESEVPSGESDSETDEMILPSPADLGIGDVSDATNPELG